MGDRAAAGGDAKLVAESALAVGHTVAEVSGDTPLLTVLDRALRQQCIAPADRARLCARRAIATYWLSGGQAESRRRSAEAVAVAREAGDPDALGAALVARQFTLRGPDHLDERIQTGAAALSLASASGDEDLRFRALQWLVPDRFQAGAMLEVAESIEELHALAERRRDPLRRWWVLIYRGLMAAFDGRFGEAEQLAHDAFTWGRRLGQPAADAYRIGQLSRIYWSTGRLSLLGSEVTDAIGRFPGLVTLRCVRALVLASSGRREEAVREARCLVGDDFAIVPRDSLFLASLALLAETVVACRDDDLAPPLLASIIHPQQPGPSRLMNGAVRLGKWGCGGRPRRP